MRGNRSTNERADSGAVDCTNGRTDITNSFAHCCAHRCVVGCAHECADIGCDYADSAHCCTNRTHDLTNITYNSTYSTYNCIYSCTDSTYSCIYSCTDNCTDSTYIHTESTHCSGRM
jgi:hypothetical protein